MALPAYKLPTLPALFDANRAERIRLQNSAIKKLIDLKQSMRETLEATEQQFVNKDCTEQQLEIVQMSYDHAVAALDAKRREQV